jgi:hypothetical protein
VVTPCPLLYDCSGYTDRCPVLTLWRLVGAESGAPAVIPAVTSPGGFIAQRASSEVVEVAPAEYGVPGSVHETGRGPHAPLLPCFRSLSSVERRALLRAAV